MNPTTITLLAAALLLPTSPAFARGHSAKEIDLLNESAAALSSTKPDLSSRLKSYAAVEAGEKEETASEQAEKSDKQDVKMLKDAAAALKGSRPDLSKGLKNYAGKEESAKTAGPDINK